MLKYLAFYLATISITAFSACSSQTSNGPANTSNGNANSPEMTADKTTKATQMPVNIAVNNLPANSGTTSTLKESTVAAVPAPDNSTFTSTMDRDGNFMEVREFTNDPEIKKVERKVLGKNSKYLVYLKNGKVVEANAEKMTNFRSLAPANILEAIGMPAKSPASKEPKVAN